MSFGHSLTNHVTNSTVQDSHLAWLGIFIPQKVVKLKGICVIFKVPTWGSNNGSPHGFSLNGHYHRCRLFVQHVKVFPDFDSLLSLLFLYWNIRWGFLFFLFFCTYFPCRSLTDLPLCQVLNWVRKEIYLLLKKQAFWGIYAKFLFTIKNLV